MVDRISKEDRSKIMSKIRSKWTSIERDFHNYLKGKKIRHKMHPDIEGKPDIILPDCKIAIFLDGCFWHGCPRHGHIPKSRIKYWEPKIRKNIMRKRKYNMQLKKDGWKVLRFWEHDVKENFEKCIKNIENTKNS